MKHVAVMNSILWMTIKMSSPRSQSCPRTRGDPTSAGLLISYHSDFPPLGSEKANCFSDYSVVLKQEIRLATHLTYFICSSQKTVR